LKNLLDDGPVIREREAWLKAGAGLVAAYSGVGILSVGVVVGALSLFYHLDSYMAAVLASVGGCAAVAIANLLVDLSARERARTGTVQPDRF
jgi:hypothetical protein